MRYLLATISLIAVIFGSQSSTNVLKVKNEYVIKLKTNTKTHVFTTYDIPCGCPLEDMTVTSSFGNRMHPIYNYVRKHSGIDLIAEMRTPVYASANGKIVLIEYKVGGYGTNIAISHKNHTRTRYAHLSKILVKVGQDVEEGDLIAYSGNTGTSTGPHLHYEISINGEEVDPIKYLKTQCEDVPKITER